MIKYAEDCEVKIIDILNYNEVLIKKRKDFRDLTMKRIRNFINKIIYFNFLLDEKDKTNVERELQQTWVPSGHFYSPIPSIDQIKLKEKEIWSKIPEEIPGIDLNINEQINLFNKFMKYYKELPFEPNKKENLRYFFENPSYSYSDAIFFYTI